MAEFVSPFSTLGNKPEEVHGEMSCHVCWEICDTGFYDRRKQTLTYVCSQGHNNTLDNYKL